MQEISHGIYYENGYPGVTLGALVLPSGTVMIDAPLRAEDARTWRMALAGQGGNHRRLLVNMDTHTDRTLGARAMECTIIAHQKTAQLFRSRPSVFKGQNADSGSEWETQNDTVGTRWAIPDITFSQQVSIHWGYPDLLLEYHPGPAAGALWALLPAEKIVFVGDAVLSNQPGFLANAELPAWLETLELLADTYGGFTVVGGRGGPVTLEDVQAQQRHLKNVLKALEKLAKHGAPPEATDDLVSSLLADFNFSPKLEEQYAQRLRHGLFQYYIRHYRPSDSAAEAV